MLSGNTSAETQPKKSEVSLGPVWSFLKCMLVPTCRNDRKINPWKVYELALKRNLQVHFEKIAEEGPPHLKHYSIKLVVGKQDGNDEEGERYAHSTFKTQNWNWTLVPCSLRQKAKLKVKSSQDAKLRLLFWKKWKKLLKPKKKKNHNRNVHWPWSVRLHL